MVPPLNFKQDEVEIFYFSLEQLIKIGITMVDFRWSLCDLPSHRLASGLPTGSLGATWSLLPVKGYGQFAGWNQYIFHLWKPGVNLTKFAQIPTESQIPQAEIWIKNSFFPISIKGLKLTSVSLAMFPT